METTIQFRHDLTLLILRIISGLVIFGHGAQKLLGWFGGSGFDDSMNYFTGTAGVPYFIGLLVILGESLGMIALILGILGRFMAGSLIVIMTGAFFIDHAQHGFFMDWFGTMNGEGFEFDILVIGMALPVLINGSGAYSLDNWLWTKLNTAQRRKIIA